MQQLAATFVLITALATGVVARADDNPVPQDGGQALMRDTPAQPPVLSNDLTATQAADQRSDPPAGSEPPAQNPPPQAAAEIPAPTPKPPPPQSAVQSVAPEQAVAILGQRVIDADGSDVGRLVDVLVDGNGQPQAAVIDFGGFMGVGNRKIAVHWSVIHFNPADPKNKITLEMTPDQVKTAPEFLNPNKAVPVVTPAAATATAP